MSGAQDTSVWADATALACSIRAGKLSATEAVEAAIDRIEDVNPHLNAVIIDQYEEARRHAAVLLDAEAPFAGVPFLLKDLGVAQAGQPFFLGNRALQAAGHRARRDSVVGARFRRLGLITVGKTNTPEMGAQTTTQPLAFGPTRNPWDLERSPSGSSGGSAAAVAAGLVPMAHGNDALGSIRLPAAWCGIVGLKPSRGRVPIGANHISRMSHEFALTRSVRDAAALLEGVQGIATGELYAQYGPAQPFIAPQRRPLSQLRVGVLEKNPAGGPVQPDIVHAVNAVGAMLESRGHIVAYAHPPALFEDQAASLQPDRPSASRARIRSIAALLGRPVSEEDVEPYLWAMAHVHEDETVDSYLAAADWQQAWSARMLGWWDRFDLLITPTVPMGPETLEELTPPSYDPTQFFDRMRSHITFTAPFNVTGQPAISLPWWDPTRRRTPPPSVQLVGAAGRDDVVLAAAYQVEEAAAQAPRPDIHA